MQLKYNKQVNVAIFSGGSLLLLMEDTLSQKPLSCHDFDLLLLRALVIVYECMREIVLFLYVYV